MAFLEEEGVGSDFDLAVPHAIEDSQFVAGERAALIHPAEQAAEYLGVPCSTLNFLTKKGRLKKFKMGRTVRYKTTDLQEFLSGSSN